MGATTAGVVRDVLRAGIGLHSTSTYLAEFAEMAEMCASPGKPMYMGPPMTEPALSGGETGWRVVVRTTSSPVK